jgi:hypothetical protein
MKCYYHKHRTLGRILIPGCMGVAIHQDIFFCTCPTYSKDRTQVLEGKIQRLEERVTELEQTVKSLTTIKNEKETL